MQLRFKCIGQPLLLLAAALFLLSLSWAAASPASIPEIKVESIPLVAKPGSRLEFSFTAGNRSGPACNAAIEYWIGEGNGKDSSGKDTVYLEEGDVKGMQAALLVPSGMHGLQEFHLQMECNSGIAVANKTIEVREAIPVLPQVNSLDVSGGSASKPAQFSYSLEANSDEPVPVDVEERVLSDGNVLWVNSRRVALSGAGVFSGEVPVLPHGSYDLVVVASVGGESARAVRSFGVVPVAPAFPWMPLVSLAALALLFAAAVLITRRFLAPGESPAAGRFSPASPGGAAQSAEAGKKERVCLAEAESSGFLEEGALSRLLDLAGLKSGEKASALEAGGRVPVKQKVKSFLVIGKKGKAVFETSVRVTIENSSNRNLENVRVLARVPRFLCSSKSRMKTGAKILKTKGKRTASFLITKIRAMQSAEIVYSVPCLLSQAEANSVPLPAVVGYTESEPLELTQVSVEQGEKGAAKAKGVVHKREKG